MFFQNIFWNQKHATNKFKQPRNCFVSDSKEIFVQGFVKVFDQNRSHLEAWNQRTGTPADFTM